MAAGSVLPLLNLRPLVWTWLKKVLNTTAKGVEQSVTKSHVLLTWRYVESGGSCADGHDLGVEKNVTLKWSEIPGGTCMSCSSTVSCLLGMQPDDGWLQGGKAATRTEHGSTRNPATWSTVFPYRTPPRRHPRQPVGALAPARARPPTMAVTKMIPVPIRSAGYNNIWAFVAATKDTAQPVQVHTVTTTR